MTTENVRFNVHIVYPWTPEIDKIFLKQLKNKRYRAERDGKFLGEDEFSKSFRENLTKIGILFIPVERVFSVGRKRVNGISIQVSKIKEKKKIKELIVRIPAISGDEAIDKKRALIDYVEGVTGIKGKEVSTTHQVVC